MAIGVVIGVTIGHVFTNLSLPFFTNPLPLLSNWVLWMLAVSHVPGLTASP